MSFAFDYVLNLPLSLSGGVLNNWLSIEHVVKLDSACCSSANRQILKNIYTSQEFIHHAQVTTSHSKELIWYVSRDIGISNLHIDAELIEDEKISCYLCKCGSKVRKIHFSGDACGALNVIPMHCRSLVSISCDDLDMEHILHNILYYNPYLKEVSFNGTNLEISMFKDIRLTHLRMLQVTGTGDLYKELCLRFGNLCDGLTHLRVASSELASPELVIDIVSRYKKLKALDLKDTNVNGIAISAVVGLCPHIVHLSLRECNDIDDTAFSFIVQNLHDLRSVDIRDCSALTDQSLINLAEHCAAQLRALYLGCTDVRWSILIALLRKCTSLHTLGLEAADIVNFDGVNMRDIFKSVHYIQRLHLHGAGLIADNVLELVGQHCKGLTHLALHPINAEDFENEPEEILHV